MHKLKSTYRCSHCELTNSRCFWTIEAAMWTACKTCFNRKRPCIKSTSNLTMLASTSAPKAPRPTDMPRVGTPSGFPIPPRFEESLSSP
ncbi:hypothetical protein DOTSEDRAFT_44105 [Dothistroma septosporum NZE10]|uniref:Uncharacterized protein n=1 Tax=Dothistroma septosporum (strain NZE10 / CBS 128990) TaxID=675120 RepID=N1PSG0_DOTSN|nr:hypothetical protein DOTSEDRAFT_44105 [Dothistroma septosporum NZE10]